MSVKVVTDYKGTKVIRKDRVSSNGNPYTTYATSVSSKNKEGEYVSAWFDLRFKKGVSVNNKAVINIKDSFFTVEEYNGNKRTSIFVMDFEVLEAGEKPQEQQSLSSDSSFMDIPDGINEELQFN